MNEDIEQDGFWETATEAEIEEAAEKAFYMQRSEYGVA